MDKDFLAEFDLDIEVIQRDLDVCENLGFTYRVYMEDKMTKESSMMRAGFAATNLRRSGSHALLLGDLKRAQQNFSAAADIYARLKMPYAIIMAAFVGTTPKEWSDIRFWQETKADDQLIDSFRHQMAYVLLAYSASALPKSNLASEQWIIMRDTLEAYRTIPMGTLGLPLGNYLDLAYFLDAEITRKRVDAEEAILPFLMSYNSAIRHAMEKHYHWRRLALPFHPIEPDVFGVLRLFQNALILKSRRKTTLVEIVESMPIGRQSKVLLLNTMRDLDQAINLSQDFDFDVKA
ncbi:MAG TPA: hypothetical protein VMF88_10745 [Bacteroidota bacterium]|nr:hypothetical protein [Bacteroidota bacterium]